MPDKEVITLVLSVGGAAIGLGTAGLTLLHKLSERQIKNADQSLPDSSFEFLNIKREPPVPRVSDKRLRLKAYRRLGLLGAILMVYGFFYSFFALYMFSLLDAPSSFRALSFANFLVAVAYFIYGFISLRSFNIWRKSPVEGPTKACQKVSLEMVADHTQTVDRSMTALRRTGAQIIEMNSQGDGCLIRAVRHYKGHPIGYYDELTIKIRTRPEKNHHSVEIEVDGLRPTFRSDETRNLLTMNKLVNEII